MNIKDIGVEVLGRCCIGIEVQVRVIISVLEVL